MKGFFLIVSLIFVAGTGHAGDDIVVSKERYTQLLQNAQIFQDVDTASLNMRTMHEDLYGRKVLGKLNGEDVEVINCKFNENKSKTKIPQAGTNGKTPKFYCDVTYQNKKGVTKTKTIKVKYHLKKKDNGEVWGEVLGTKFLTALGFFTDRVHPAKVICQGCPKDPWNYLQRKHERDNPGKSSSTQADANLMNGNFGNNTNVTKEEKNLHKQTVTFEYASIEKKHPGEVIEQAGVVDRGWHMNELSQYYLSGNYDRATAEKASALMMALVFIQHADNKPSQQRLVCPDDAIINGGRDCEDGKARMVVQDLGSIFSFGAGKSIVGIDYMGSEGKVNLGKWKKVPMWRDEANCKSRLKKTHNPLGVGDPKVTGDGRRLLVSKLQQLSREQIVDLFSYARIKARRGNTAEDWADAILKRTYELANSTCN